MQLCNHHKISNMELKNWFILRNFPIRGKARGCFRREKEQMKVKGIN